MLSAWEHDLGPASAATFTVASNPTSTDGGPYAPSTYSTYPIGRMDYAAGWKISGVEINVSRGSEWLPLDVTDFTITFASYDPQRWSKPLPTNLVPGSLIYITPPGGGFRMCCGGMIREVYRDGDSLVVSGIGLRDFCLEQTLGRDSAPRSPLMTVAAAGGSDGSYGYLRVSDPLGVTTNAEIGSLFIDDGYTEDDTLGTVIETIESFAAGSVRSARPTSASDAWLNWTVPPISPGVVISYANQRWATESFGYPPSTAYLACRTVYPSSSDNGSTVAGVRDSYESPLFVPGNGSRVIFEPPLDSTWVTSGAVADLRTRAQMPVKRHAQGIGRWQAVPSDILTNLVSDNFVRSLWGAISSGADSGDPSSWVFEDGNITPSTLRYGWWLAGYTLSLRTDVVGGAVHLISKVTDFLFM